MVEGVAPWKNFDDIEDNLILDELLLLNEVMHEKKRAELNIQIALAGGEPMEDDVEDTDDDSGLPLELIEAEREWKKRKSGMLEEMGEPMSEEEKSMRELGEIGFGYKKNV